jgi:hypothetical protein
VPPPELAAARAPWPTADALVQHGVAIKSLLGHIATAPVWTAQAGLDAGVAQG